MPISLLRRQSRPREPELPPAIGALSLPDLTVPLIDPAAWAAMPRSADPGGPGGPAWFTSPDAPRTQPAGLPPDTESPPDITGTYTANYYSASPAGAASPRSSLSPHPYSHSSHSPPSPGGFSPGGFSPGGFHSPAHGRAPALIRDANGNQIKSFHRPFSPALSPGGVTAAARRGKARRTAPLTVMVVGPRGSGKTSFISALKSVLGPDAQRMHTRTAATTSVKRHELLATSERRAFTILDTPGLPPPDDAARRARALTALLGIVEDRLAHQLSEENKVVRRKSDGAELVHLIVYVVDARTALVTPAAIDIDWDTIAEPPAKAPRPESKLDLAVSEDVEARFPVEDIEAIRRFSARANVLPILTHADALTTKELKAVRDAVSRDLSTVFGRDPLGTWGILSASTEMDMEEDDPMSDRISLDSKRAKSNVPFAIFAPEPGPEFVRAFRWGCANAGDAEHSDLPAIRDAFVTSADWLRTSTREVVYEKFRTEKLLSARGVRPAI